MKTIIISVLMLSISFLTAQTENKKTTVRVKKVEKINGVEKMVDTTYTIDGNANIHNLSQFDDTTLPLPCDGKQEKIVIVTDEVVDGNTSVVEKDKIMDEQIERALKAAGVDSKTLAIDQVLVSNKDVTHTDKNGVKKTTKIVIIKAVKLTDLSEEDSKSLAQNTSLSNNKLVVDKIDFYPNPNNGKFQVSFSLAKKSDTDVTILNMDGKTIYSEKLNNFSGNYDKEIDISGNPKGIYFIKIAQGADSQMKKIVID